MATPLSNTVPLSGTAQIDGLVQGGAWQAPAPGAPTALTYSFSLNDGPADPTWGGYGLLQQSVVNAFQQWANVANVTFVEQGSGTVFSNSPADIAVMLVSEQDLILGFGVFPDPSFADAVLAEDGGYTRTTYPHPEGDIIFNVGQPVMAQAGAGSYGYAVVLHEIGHALGMKHPYDDGGNARPTFGALGIGPLDKVTYTVMSDTDANGMHDFLGTQPSSPMPLDILAIQRIYGANTSFHAGDDTYRLVTETGVRTVWDAGGVDTFDASTLSTGVTLDLNPGAITDLGNGHAIAIAYGSVIERAVGSSWSDVIIGNDAANRLEGGTGSDRMEGGKGDDEYWVSEASDVVIERPGEGHDSIWSPINYSLPDNVENLTLSPFTLAVSAVGNSLDNVLTGNNQDNVLSGGGGNDYLDGKSGHDTLIGGPGNDTYLLDTYVPAAPPTYVQLTGPSGAFIADGTTITKTPDDGTLSFTLLDERPDGLVDGLRFDFSDGVKDYHIDLSASDVFRRDYTLTVGNYSTERYAGLAKFDVYTATEHATNTLASFNIYALDIDYSSGTPQLLKLKSDFVFYDNSAPPGLSGVLNFNAGTAEVVDNVIENANEGNDTIVVPFTYALTTANVENLTLSGSGNIDGTGTAGDNVLTGNAGINTLTGGEGNDTYVIQNTGDVVTENPGEGIDTVAIEAGYIDGNGRPVFAYTLPGNIENAAYRGHAAFTLTGNALDNGLTGGDRSDRLVGLGGNDSLDGGPGYDTAVFSGARSSYTVLHRGAALVVVDANAGTSSTVTNVERVAFSDSFLLTKTAPAQLDFGSDGRSELLMRNATTGLVQLWAMDGTRPGVASDVAVAGGEWTVVGNGDFNGDGRGDILWRDGNGLLATWEMDQSTLLAGSTVQTVANDWKVTGTGNFNSDVYNDILWRNDNGQVGLWEMKGSSFLAASVIVTGTPHDEIPTNWQIQGAGDFNGDGKTDILWRDYDTGDMGVWEMYGSTIAGATVVDAPPPTSWTIVGMGDFNADHHTDVLWRNGNELDVWLMDGGHSIGRGALETVGADQTVVGVGDISGDGRADVLLQNTSGILSAHLVDGLTVTAQANVGTVGSDWVLT